MPRNPEPLPNPVAFIPPSDPMTRNPDPVGGGAVEAPALRRGKKRVMGFVDDHRRRGRVNEGRDQKEAQPEPEQESPSAPMPGLGRPGGRPNQQNRQENDQDLFHFSLPAQPLRLRLCASFRGAHPQKRFRF